jgi:hypothetical protein
VYDYIDPFVLKTRIPNSRVIESSHNYTPSDTEQYFEVSIPNTEVIGVVFDEKSSTEENAKVRLYKQDPRTGGSQDDLWVAPLFGSESSNFPGTGPRPMLLVGASRFVVGFRTAGTNGDWGFRMCAFPSVDPLREWAGLSGECKSINHLRSVIKGLRTPVQSLTLQSSSLRIHTQIITK